MCTICILFGYVDPGIPIWVPGPSLWILLQKEVYSLLGKFWKIWVEVLVKEGRVDMHSDYKDFLPRRSIEHCGGFFEQLRLMIYTLHYLTDPRLWTLDYGNYGQLWYIPYYG